MDLIIKFNESKYLNNKKIILESYIKWFINNKKDNVTDDLFNYQCLNFKNFLFENTNLKQILNQQLLSFKKVSWHLIFPALEKDILSSEDITNLFFELLSERFSYDFSEYKKEKNIPFFNYILVTNINLTKDTTNYLKEACKSFEEIKLMDDELISEFISKKYFNCYENHFKRIKNFNLQFFKVSIKSRSKVFANELVSYKIEQFFGYVNFVLCNDNKFFGKLNGKNVFDYSISKIYPIPLMNLVEEPDGKCSFISDSTFNDKILQELQSININLWGVEEKLDNLLKYNSYFQNMKGDIKNKFLEYCAIYFAASFESSIQTSFVYYWSLMEQIIKMDEERLKDKYVRKRLIYFYETFMDSDELVDLRGAINLLYNKRNLQVHEAKFGVNEYDRNFIKRIVDKMLVMFLENSNDADSLNYFATEVYKWSPDYVTIPLEQEYRCFPENDYD